MAGQRAPPAKMAAGRRAGRSLADAGCSVDHAVAVGPLLEDGLALLHGHSLHHLGRLPAAVLDEVLDVVDALLEAALCGHLLRDAAVDVRDPGPEDRAQRHEVRVRGAVDAAPLEVVRAEPAAGYPDRVHLGRGGGVAALQHGVGGLGDHLAVLDDDRAEGLALLRLAETRALRRRGDGHAHHPLVVLEKRLDVRQLDIGRLRVGAAHEDLRVGLGDPLAVPAAEAAAQGPVHRRVREELHDLVLQQAVVDLDHVLLDAHLALLGARRGVGDEAAARDAVAAGLVVDLVVEDLVVKAVLRRGVPVHADVDLAEARPLDGPPAHGARLAGGVEVAVGQVVGPERLARLLDRVHLGVPRGVLAVEHHVVRAGDDDAVPDDGAAEGAPVLQPHASEGGARSGLHEGRGDGGGLLRGRVGGDSLRQWDVLPDHGRGSLRGGRLLHGGLRLGLRLDGGLPRGRLLGLHGRLLDRLLHDEGAGHLGGVLRGVRGGWRRSRG
mmetsp:Transcript_67321/g.197647  ORF Transcript_67321/g.197647 Transcript_67321/m.197647 type:complete len:495 (+) Transcript_67321:426-1910(+)